MPFADLSALVAGCGSIGQRHLRNLHHLGLRRLTTCDPDPDRLAPLAAELPIRTFSGFEEALNQSEPDLVFICTPPIYHVAQALKALRTNAHVFVEKPLSHTLTGVAELAAEARARRRIVQVGYNLRFHPGIRQLKKMVEEKIIGRVLYARAEVGQYLPEWRPWQDYRVGYSARRELGGGIILDASHEIDYIIWLLGKPSEVFCMADRVSDLEVDVEDCATLLLRFEDRCFADVHMDFIQRTYARTCKIVGSEGTLWWDYSLNEVRLTKPGGQAQTVGFEFDADQMYLDELHHFLTCVETRIDPLVTLEAGRNTMEVAAAALVSAAEGRRVRLV